MGIAAADSGLATFSTDVLVEVAGATDGVWWIVEGGAASAHVDWGRVDTAHRLEPVALPPSVLTTVAADRVFLWKCRASAAAVFSLWPDVVGTDSIALFTLPQT